MPSAKSNTSECMHSFELRGGVDIAYSKPVGNAFEQVRVEKLSLCPEVLLVPLGVPPTPAPACFTLSCSQDSEMRRVPTTTDVGRGGGG